MGLKAWPMDFLWKSMWALEIQGLFACPVEFLKNSMGSIRITFFFFALIPRGIPGSANRAAKGARSRFGLERQLFVSR